MEEKNKLLITCTRDEEVLITVGSHWYSCLPKTKVIQGEDFKVESADFRRGTRFTTEPSSEALVITNKPDQKILSSLVTKYGIVMQTSSIALTKYYHKLDRLLRAHEINAFYQRITSDEASINIKELIHEIGIRSSYDVNLDRLVNYMDHIFGKMEEGQDTIYSPGILNNFTIVLWNRLTESEPVYLHLQTEGGVVTLNLLEEVLPLCTKLTSLLSAGCLACPNRDNCVDSLIEEDLTISRPSVEQLKRVVKNKGTYIPHSIVYSMKKLDKVSVSSLMPSKSYDLFIQHKNKKKLSVANAKFFRENCSSCSLKDYCGNSSSYHFGREYTINDPYSIGRNENNQITIGTGNTSFCAGKTTKTVVINSDNYKDILLILVEAIMLGQVKGVRNYEAVLQTVEILDSFIQSSGKLDRATSYYLPNLFKRVKNTEDHDLLSTFIIPTNFLEIGDLLHCNSGRGTMFAYCGLTNWFKNVTKTFTKSLPSVKEGNWVALFASNQIKRWDHLDPHEQQFYAIDTRVLADMQNVQLNNKYSNKLTNIEERIRLVLLYMNLFVVPSLEWRSGSFGCYKHYVPSGILSKWNYKHSRWEVTIKDQYLDCASLLQITLENIFKVPMNYETKYLVTKTINKLKDVI